ncbi:MAG: hypothetical protein GY952_07285 [Rhodobacteraceae bacterium]|nr:hypothetical protein [Paracoccaceae bacterium]
MSEKLQEHEKFYRRDNPLVWGIIASLLIFIVTIFVAFLDTCNGVLFWQECETKFSYLLGTSPNEFGDWLAGFAGSLAFVWIVVAVLLQKDELEQQRQVLTDQKEEFSKSNIALQKQNFEAFFFELLRTHNTIVSDIDLANTRSGIITRGRDCFPVFYGRIGKKYREGIKNSRTESEALYFAYEAMYDVAGSDLGHYFRFLFNSFKFLEQSNSTKPVHIKLLRSILSDHELLLIFYNALTPRGENFRTYIETFELFDNLPRFQLLSSDHAMLYAPKCYGLKKIPDGKTLGEIEKAGISHLRKLMEQTP